MAVEPNAAGDKPQGDQGQVDKPAAQGAIAPEVLQAIKAAVQEVSGPMVTGAVRRHLADAFTAEPFVKTLDEVVRGAINKGVEEKAKKPPTEMEKITSEMNALKEQLRAKDMEAKQAKLNNGIAQVLDRFDGREGRPCLRSTAKADLAYMLRQGIDLPATPDFDSEGNLVVRDNDGIDKRLEDVLNNGFLQKRDYLLERQQSTGSGARGNNGFTPATPRVNANLKDVFGTEKGNRVIAEMYAQANGDPERIALIAAEINKAVM